MKNELEANSFSELFEAAQAHDEYWTERAMMEFTEELVRWMEMKNVSRAGLAEAIGSSLPYVTKALKGNVNFTLATMVKLSRALGARVSLQLVPLDENAEDMPLEEVPRRRHG